jgi:hypothetical protein
VETPFGNQAIGVLLAPTHDQWVARIITYPNVLWSAPGGRGALKFVGETAEQAEAQAIAFVERHLLAKRYLRRDAMNPVGVLSAPKAPAGVARPGIATVPRKLRCLPVRFGLDRARFRGMTVSVSVEGMFIGVATPESSGTSLLIHLDLDGHTLPLRGLVMWQRERPELARPAGMGVLLAEPPAMYQSFVAALP